MQNVPQNWDGSPSFSWRVRHWFWSHIGLFILAVMVALWFLAPATAAAILDANMAIMRKLATWFAAVVSNDWGGSIPLNVITLMDKITEIIREMVKLKWIQDMGFGPRTEIFFRMIYEGIFLYFEIKIVRFAVGSFLLLLRGIAKIGSWLTGAGRRRNKPA